MNSSESNVIGAKASLARDGQALSSHLNAVANMARKFAEPFELGSVAYASGLLHDLGKYSSAFQNYLSNTLRGRVRHRGEVHHAWQGAQIALERLEKNAKQLGWQTSWPILSLLTMVG